MSLRNALKKLYGDLRLIKRSQTAFDLSSRGEDRLAFHHISSTKEALGSLMQYQHGVELVLLEMFLRGRLVGLSSDDYDWEYVRDHIFAASEYNRAEKLHLLVYLEELATTAGITLPLAGIGGAAAPTEHVAGYLVRRFPKLSTT